MMKTILQYACLSCLLFFLGCKDKFYTTNNAYAISTVNNNVCKKLNGKVILYAMFIDTRQVKPWSNHDIYSTLDSIKKATSWLMLKAKDRDIPLSIQVEYHVKNDTVPIEQHLYGESLSEMLFSKDGITMIDLWSNSIARKAGMSFSADTAVVMTKNVISNRERLIARLRDKHKTDNVVLMYFINNYYTEEISVALFTTSAKSTEFSIVSFKYPAVIAHEFLHVFGGLDLYISPFDRKKKAIKNRVAIMKAYPNEVMAYAYRPIEKLDISPITEYLIGWKDSLVESDRKLLVGKKINLYKY